MLYEVFCCARRQKSLYVIKHEKHEAKCSFLIAQTLAAILYSTVYFNCRYLFL